MANPSNEIIKNEIVMKMSICHVETYKPIIVHIHT